MKSIGQCIQIIGNSCAGKSTFAHTLARAKALPHVELDALNWLPNWVGLHSKDPAELERRVAEATSGDRWVIDGSYLKYTQKVCWPRLETLIWLDLPRHLLVKRFLKRSWNRSRNSELLWGTNTERFLPHLKIWKREESLLWWIWTQHKSKQRELEALMKDPQWNHIRFIRLKSEQEIAEFFESVRSDHSAIDQ